MAIADVGGAFVLRGLEPGTFGVRVRARRTRFRATPLSPSPTDDRRHSTSCFNPSCLASTPWSCNRHGDSTSAHDLRPKSHRAIGTPRSRRVVAERTGRRHHALRRTRIAESRFDSRVCGERSARARQRQRRSTRAITGDADVSAIGLERVERVQVLHRSAVGALRRARAGRRRPRRNTSRGARGVGRRIAPERGASETRASRSGKRERTVARSRSGIDHRGLSRRPRRFLIRRSGRSRRRLRSARERRRAVDGRARDAHRSTARMADQARCRSEANGSGALADCPDRSCSRRTTGRQQRFATVGRTRRTLGVQPAHVDGERRSRRASTPCSPTRRRRSAPSTTIPSMPIVSWPASALSSARRRDRIARRRRDAHARRDVVEPRARRTDAATPVWRRGRRHTSRARRCMTSTSRRI